LFQQGHAAAEQIDLDKFAGFVMGEKLFSPLDFKMHGFRHAIVQAGGHRRQCIVVNGTVVGGDEGPGGAAFHARHTGHAAVLENIRRLAGPRRLRTHTRRDQELDVAGVSVHALTVIKQMLDYPQFTLGQCLAALQKMHIAGLDAGQCRQTGLQAGQ
jgi:hypothetical protein